MSSQVLGREVRIFWAISETKSSSTRGAANLEAVPRSTLRDQMNGRQSVQKAHEKFLSLTPVQERELVNLILLREKDFQPLLKQEIHLCAQHLTELNGLGSHLGKKWIGRFFQRHNTIILKPSRLISKARKRAVITGGLREYYDGLSNILRHLHVGSDRIYNLDETGLQEGESLAGVVGGTVLTTSSERSRVMLLLGSRS
jgi:hypothetical protein